MKSRVLIPELMDNPDLDASEHFRALQGLRRINTWTRNAALAWRSISDLAESRTARPLRVLDLATGAADIPIRLWRLAASRGVELEIEACDFSDKALEFAESNCAQAKAPIRIFHHDILQQAIPQQYDVVICSQFLHHFTKPQVSEILSKMANASTRRVVVIDLVRSRLNWLQVWLATRVLSRSKVVHFDGPQSVRAAFTIDELRELADSCGFCSLTMRSHWPCRMSLVGLVSNDD